MWNRSGGVLSTNDRDEQEEDEERGSGCERWSLECAIESDTFR